MSSAPAESLYRDRLALITGASGGVGSALARALAQRGSRLILAGCGAEPLARVADEVHRHGAKPIAVDADITTDAGLAQIERAVAESGQPVDLLVNAAGFLTFGDWHRSDIEREIAMVRLHVEATMRLTHRYLPGMIQRHSGGVIILASIAAFMPTPMVATYGATKAFLLSWSEALWIELQGSGVRVLAMCPGPMRTGIFAAAGVAMSKRRRVDVDVDAAVERALRAFERGRSFVVPGKRARALTLAPRFFPRSIIAKESGVMVRRWLEPAESRETPQAKRPANGKTPPT